MNIPYVSFVTLKIKGKRELGKGKAHTLLTPSLSLKGQGKRERKRGIVRGRPFPSRFFLPPRGNTRRG